MENNFPFQSCRQIYVQIIYVHQKYMTYRIIMALFLGRIQVFEAWSLTLPKSGPQKYGKFT